jgi:hypothetical protein
VEVDEETVDVSLRARKKIAHLEFLVTCYKENLTSFVGDTMNLVRKKQSRSYDDGDLDQDAQENN